MHKDNTLGKTKEKGGYTMKRRRNKRREKMIMLYSSALVLTVLTLTGVYVKEKNTKQEDYVVDLSLLEEEKIEEKEETVEPEEAALVDSKKVENENILKEDKDFPWETADIKKRDSEIIIVENETEQEIVEEQLEFTEEDTLLWPIVGNILIDYSMEKPVYFASLEQYKYHPAIVIKAEIGQNITAVADGRITKIEKKDQLGNVITMELGNGYEVDYGQLKNIQVKVGDRVKQGDYLADVAEPTKFYSVEGCNVYFALRKDGKPLNPMDRIQ